MLAFVGFRYRGKVESLWFLKEGWQEIPLSACREDALNYGGMLQISRAFESYEGSSAFLFWKRIYLDEEHGIGALQVMECD